MALAVERAVVLVVLLRDHIVRLSFGKLLMLAVVEAAVLVLVLAVVL